MTDFNAAIIDEFRANGGKAPSIFGDLPLVIVHTIGARSGEVREIPLVPQLDGETKYIFASKAGATSHPDWYHNLKANPDVTIEFGEGTESVRAVEITGDDRDRVYAAQAAAMPQFAEYEVQAGDRVIPVFALEPR